MRGVVWCGVAVRAVSQCKLVGGVKNRLHMLRARLLTIKSKLPALCISLSTSVKVDVHLYVPHISIIKYSSTGRATKSVDSWFYELRVRHKC